MKLLDPIKEQLTPIREDLQTRYYQLPDRDRQMLTVLALFLSLALLYIAVIKPINNFASTAEQKYISEQQFLMKMQSYKSALSGNKKRGGGTKGRKKSLDKVVNKLASEYGITLKRFEPQSDGSLRVWMERVEFNQLILWMDELTGAFGVSLSSVSIDSQKETGRVNAKLVLTR